MAKKKNRNDKVDDFTEGEQRDKAVSIHIQKH